MQIKRMLRVHLISVRMTSKKTSNKCWKGTFQMLAEINIIPTIMEITMDIPPKILKLELQYDPKHMTEEI